MRWLRFGTFPVALVLLLVVPWLHFSVPGVLPGPLSSPGTLQLLAVCVVFGALALSYDLLFGFTGLLSFGHALFFALGVYGCDIALSHWGWSLGGAIALTAALGVVVPLVVGAVSLRVTGIAFAMVTLAFAQVGSILVYRNPSGATGGEEGLGLKTERMPNLLVGVVNTKNLYWLSVLLLVFVYAVVSWATRSRPGRVWAAIRENERRVTVLGLKPYTFKLAAFVLGSFLATVTGVAYLFLQGGATPQVTTPEFTLSLLVMVVLGGAGYRWGAVVGGMLYTFLDERLGSLAASHAIASLPAPLRVALSQPLFILGVLFIVFVVFVPGGIAATVRRVVDRGTAPADLGPPVTRQVLAAAAQRPSLSRETEQAP